LLLIRNELSVLERSEQLARRKKTYEALHPRTKNGGDRKSGEAKSERNDFALIPAFAEATAKAVGSSKRTVEQEVQIASRLSSEVKDAIRGSDVADRKADLLALARVKEPAKQKAIADKLVKGEAKDFRQANRDIMRGERVGTVNGGLGGLEGLGHGRMISGRPDVGNFERLEILTPRRLPR